MVAPRTQGQLQANERVLASPSSTRSAGATTAPQSGTGNFSFSIDQFTQSLDEQAVLTQQRQAAQIAQGNVQAGIMDRSKKLAAAQVDSLGFMRDDLATAQQKAAHARKLADSMNPLDTLRLMGLQLMDPNGYIRENREKRLQEDSQQVAIQSQIYGIGQEALKQELLASTAGVDQATLLENIGTEKLKSFAANAALLHENMSALETMKQDAIHTMTAQELAAAITQSKAPGSNGSANIAGIDVDLRTLEERKANLDERDYQMELGAYTRILGRADIANLNTVLEGKALENTLQQDRNANATTELALQRGEREARVAALSAKNQEKIVRTFSMKELLDLQANHYKDASGLDYNPVVVDTEYDRQNQALNNRVQTAVRDQQLGSFDMQDLADEKARLSITKSRFVPGSAGAKAAAEYEKTINFAALGAGPTNDLVTRVVAQTAFSKAQQDFYSKVEAQAKKDAPNDVNEQKLRTAYYTGNPVPQDALKDAAADRLRKFKSLSDILPSDVALKVESKYKELLGAARAKANDPAAYSKPDAVESKLIEENAIQQAIEFGVNDSLNGGTTDLLIGGQVGDPTHPLFKRWNPMMIVNAMKTADDKAKGQFMQDHQLSEGDVQNIIDGKPVSDNRDTTGLNAELIYKQHSEFLLSLDAYEPGMGHEVANWWQSQGAGYVQNQAANAQSAAASSFQGANMLAVSSDVQSQALNTYALGLGGADDQSNAQNAQRNADFINFGNDPKNTQIALLSADKNLSAGEKQQLFTEVIQPLLVESQQKGMDYESTNLAIEQKIMNYEAVNPGLKSVLKTLRRDRPQLVEKLNGDMKTISFLMYPFGPYIKGKLESGATAVGWYRELTGKNPAGDAAIQKRGVIPRPNQGPLNLTGVVPAGRDLTIGTDSGRR
jgi:hypothetical protein